MEIQPYIKKINETDDLEEIGSTLSIFTEGITEELIEGINTERIAKLIEKTESISEIAYLLERVGKIGRGFKERLEDDLDFTILVNKIKKTPSLGIILLLNQFSGDLILELIKNINLADLEYEINNEISTWAIGLVIKIMREKSLTIARKLAKSIDLDSLSESIRKDTNVWGICVCFRELLMVDPRVWISLATKVDFSVLAGKVENVNATGISRLLEILSIDETVGQRLVTNLDFDKVANRIDESSSLFYILNIIENLMKIGDTFGRQLLEKIDVEKLATKLNQESKGFRRYARQMLSQLEGTEKLVRRIKVA